MPWPVGAVGRQSELVLPGSCTQSTEWEACTQSGEFVNGRAGRQVTCDERAIVPLASTARLGRCTVHAIDSFRNGKIFFIGRY